MLTNHDVVDPTPSSPSPSPMTATPASSSSATPHRHEPRRVDRQSGHHRPLRRRLHPQAKEEKVALEDIIGQFGVGFYSVFMAAKEEPSPPLLSS
ncbi:MAG: hypothetical protein R2838_06810 [Caldilineaceae bacterium]